jgi:hypothetical protein
LHRRECNVGSERPIAGNLRINCNGAQSPLNPLPNRKVFFMVSQTINNALLTPAEIEWRSGPDILPPGAQEARLYGDPAVAGLFSLRFKLPKGYSVPPHTLSKAGLFTVISGSFRIGMGEKADASKARDMPAGSFIALAPSTPHFVSVDEETVVQLNNNGPWEITYLDPNEDPRQNRR